MRKTKQILVLCMIGLLLWGTALPAAAVTELESAAGSYVFSYWGDSSPTPTPYETLSYVDFSRQGEAAPVLTDLAGGEDGRLYLADSANSCIWVLDEELHILRTYSEYETVGGTQLLRACEGVWVAGDRLYVANTGAANIVILSLATGETLQVVEAPTDEEWSSTVAFEPVRLSTDAGGRLYVIARNQTQGIVEFSPQGEFTGYLGALDVDPSVWDILVRTFGTAEMKKRTLQLVPTEFTNLVCDADGMVYAITETVTDSNIRSAIDSRSGENLPVRLLNPQGNDILRNRGYFPPVGDIDFTLSGADSGASRFVDVAVGPDGLYSLLDRKRSKVFTYDGDGNLLYVFGGQGDGLGKFEQPVSLVYVGENIAVLDQSTRRLTLFTPTAFARQVIAAYAAHEAGDAQEEEDCWRALEQEFGGYDLASLGIGKALYNRGEYRQSMAYFELANNKEYYSNAYKGLQAQITEQYLIWFVLGAVTLIAAAVVLVRLLKRHPVKIRIPGGKSLSCGWYIMTHPFDGFWELKWEKRGTVSGATAMLGAAFVLYILNARCAPYLFCNQNLPQVNSLIDALSLVAVFLFWIVASWCLTTLFDGKGTIRDIYIYSCYCLTPYVLFSLPVLAVGQFLTLEMSALYTTLQWIPVIYGALLLVTGTLTVHQFTLGKTMLMLPFSIAGVMLILFLIVLCAGLAGNIVDFIAGAVREIALRYS